MAIENGRGFRSRHIGKKGLSSNEQINDVFDQMHNIEEGKEWLLRPVLDPNMGLIRGRKPFIPEHKHTPTPEHPIK